MQIVPYNKYGDDIIGGYHKRAFQVIALINPVIASLSVESAAGFDKNSLKFFPADRTYAGQFFRSL
jgi:hypothetical protein